LLYKLQPASYKLAIGPCSFSRYAIQVTSLLFGIILSAILSATSLLVVLLRVSPLTSPGEALPAFFLSLFLTISAIASLCFYGLWRVLPIHAWDSGKLLSISLRQGVLLGFIVITLILFHLLGLLTWWIAVMIVAVFVCIELAFNV
jgi:hypothetical protein